MNETSLNGNYITTHLPDKNDKMCIQLHTLYLYTLRNAATQASYVSEYRFPLKPDQSVCIASFSSLGTANIQRDGQQVETKGKKPLESNVSQT